MRTVTQGAHTGSNKTHGFQLRTCKSVDTVRICIHCEYIEQLINHAPQKYPYFHLCNVHCTMYIYYISVIFKASKLTENLEKNEIMKFSSHGPVVQELPTYCMVYTSKLKLYILFYTSRVLSLLLSSLTSSSVLHSRFFASLIA